MSNESYFFLRHMRPWWLFPLLLSVPTYVRRFFFVAVLVPCGLPLSVILLYNLGSITGATQTVLKMAAGTGTDPNVITVHTCDDDFVRSGEHKFEPHTCSHFRTDNVPIAELAADSAKWLPNVYLCVAFITWIVCANRWRPTPLAFHFKRRRARDSGNARSSHRASAPGDEK
ncbi:hypothetical protein [Burkholderia gladioli]|uniref:hypothetical protein n=1 Tax=Burkholderia gladioli TaxID=28095 RepID=UPI000F52E5C3|nr:hypothetical protein [Burkholderia gladioli]